MGKKLYVGNLGYQVTDSDLSKLFAPHGTVQSAQIIMDRDTGRAKGFGFVEMGSEQEAQAAIAALNGAEVRGLVLMVNEVRPKEGTVSRPRSGGYGGRQGRDSLRPLRSTSGLGPNTPLDDPGGALVPSGNSVRFSLTFDNSVPPDKAKEFLKTLSTLIGQAGGTLQPPLATEGVDDER